MTYMFNTCKSLTTIPLFNTGSVTNMADMFYGCSALTSVPILNTSNVTNMYYMFNNCSALTSVPLLSTDSATNVSSMFYGTKLVQSGALALYQQMSSQTTPPSSHASTFKNCGSSTTSGAAELAQIPSDWK
jgi:surface protein